MGWARFPAISATSGRHQPNGVAAARVGSAWTAHLRNYSFLGLGLGFAWTTEFAAEVAVAGFAAPQVDLTVAYKSAEKPRISETQIMFSVTAVVSFPASKLRGFQMKRAVLYLRVSTVEQTTANQERELQAIAERMGWEIAKVYKDHGISGAKGRNGVPPSTRCAGTPPSVGST
jgi:Resolvase, N terminal domain